MLCTSNVMAQNSADNTMEDIQQRVTDLENNVPLRVGIGVETLYILADSSEASRDRAGIYLLDKFEMAINGDFDGGLYYRSRWDYQVSQQAFFPAWTYAGLKHNDDWSTEVGVIIQPLGAGVDGSYYDNSFLSDVPLWLGLANNSEPGIKTKFKQGNTDWVFAFTKNAEIASKPTARFRPDLIAQDITDSNGDTLPLSEVEVNNTFHGGGAYTIDLDGASLQLGSNGQYGDLYNAKAAGNGGEHWAATAFANYNAGGFALTLQGMTYDYNLDRAPAGAPPAQPRIPFSCHRVNRFPPVVTSTQPEFPTPCRRPLASLTPSSSITITIFSTVAAKTLSPLTTHNSALLAFTSQGVPLTPGSVCIRPRTPTLQTADLMTTPGTLSSPS
jgi:hypothetical protein